MMQHIPPMGVHSGRSPTSEELIEVSDDETSDSDASGEDSDDETASEASTTEEKQSQNSASPQNIQMEQNLKQIYIHAIILWRHRQARKTVKSINDKHVYPKGSCSNNL